MKNILKFEIVLVYYKRPQIVLNALDSIKQLQYTNWHLTFIDDSGDDSFKDTLLEYGLDNKKVTYVASLDSEEIKKGQGGSRHGYFMNEAIHNSDSDVVVILCDDDAIVDGYFEYLDEYYRINPEVNWAYCKLLFFNPTTQHYLEASTSCEYSHPGSTYTLNNYEQPLIPMGKLDGSQITFRTKVFKEGDISYPYPQTRGLDANIFSKIVEKYGLCYPTYIYGQYKGAFADQLGNRWTEKGDEFNINNK